MTIDKLIAGQEVTLEILIGGSSFEFKTQVVGTNAGTGALVKPYIYNEQVVDFANGSPESMSFSLHCIDPYTGGRVVWKNLSVNVVNFKGIDYYAIDAKAFGKIAASSERREDVRVTVNTPGSALKEDGHRFSVSVLDISDAGISFIGNSYRVTIGDIVEINFADNAKNSDFSLAVKARIVRAEAESNGILYAGKILERDNKLLAYLCFKGMEEKASKLVN
ncbi:MAG: PilZ domain-containing protein [Pseudobutyrivibrio sp.]|nr:PilZ domain-containing protein [Pseudobutyrivibrio sp.]